MSKAELLALLRALADVKDAERAHAEADDALLDYINDPDIRAEYEQVDKWYA